MGEAAPLIVSCGLDAESFGFFNTLRQANFPSERNHLRAHLTLFHHLPGDRLDEAQAALAAAAVTPPPTLEVTGLRKLGGGVAYAIHSEALGVVRQTIASRFADSLTSQDRQGFRPHVTVQNKVTAAVASALHEDLAANFSPFAAKGTSLQLWRYCGGPWEAAGEFSFSG